MPLHDEIEKIYKLTIASDEDNLRKRYYFSFYLGGHNVQKTRQDYSTLRYQ